MSELVFYEKPGCIGNARQKQLLARLGHRLSVRDLLRTPWTQETLRRRCAGFVPGPVLAALGVQDSVGDLDSCARGTHHSTTREPSCDARAAACRSGPARRETLAPEHTADAVTAREPNP